MGIYTKRFFGDESGAVAATYALALIPLIAFAGVAFDYARVMGLDSELQNGADQAALAAASQLDGREKACERAVNAAVNMLNNSTLLADDAGRISISDELLECDNTTGPVQFYKDYTDPDTFVWATNDSDANFVRVQVDVEQSRYYLMPITGMLPMSPDIGGVAVAGLSSAICKLPPVMMCNPDEINDEGFDVERYIGKGLLLISNDGGAPYGPGNFGYLETSIGKSAAATAETLGRSDFPGNCVSMEKVVTKPGAQVSVLDALNTRFGIYTSVNNACGKDGSLCPPAANSRQDLLKGNGDNCSLTGDGGFTEGPNPYRPSSAVDDLADPTTLDPMGYPRDKCHAAQLVSDRKNNWKCKDKQLGDGNWDRRAYFTSNSHIWPGGAPSTSIFSGYGNQPQNALLRPTRYQVYRYETAKGKLTEWNENGLRAQGVPICNGPGVSPDPGPDRRVLTIAVVNCNSQASKIAGSTPIEPVDWIDIFLVEPAVQRGSGSNQRTEKFDVYVEVIGPTTLGGGSTQGQQIRKDVPYLIE